MNKDKSKGAPVSEKEVKDKHPKYYENVKVNCSCGNTFQVSSTKPDIETEVCFKCHPFYTGKDKIIDAMGRVERFKKRVEKGKTFQKTKK